MNFRCRAPSTNTLTYLLTCMQHFSTHKTSYSYQQKPEIIVRQSAIVKNKCTYKTTALCALYTVSQKTHQLWNGIAKDYKDQFWWNLAEILKVSRIEFACFSFHIGLLFYELFVFKTETENNANFDAVSSKRGSFDAIQQRRPNFDQKSVWM